VGLLLANNQPMQAKGIVETIESEFDHETGNIAFRARFPNPERILKNGETGKVLMTVPLSHALVIPMKATYELQDKLYVYVVDAHNVIHSKLITIRGRMPDLFVIDNGLEEGDKILLEGIQKVKEEDRIQYEFVSPEEVMTHLRLKAE
jgi:membrane fusion protein (multidrug efflux system)